MHLKTVMPQDPGPSSSQQTTLMRDYGRQRALTLPPMTTEYRERFLPPCRCKKFISTPILKDPFRALKGRASMATFKKSTDIQRCITAPHNAAGFALTRLASKLDNYKSVYQNDFQAWKANRTLPYRVHESPQPNQGLGFTDGTSCRDQYHNNTVQMDTNSKAAFESITSYRSDYVAHSLPLRIRREKLTNQTSRELPLNPAVSFGPNLVWQTNRDHSDRGSAFKTWPLEDRPQCQDKAGGSRPPADLSAFVSTTHAAYVPHKCERTKPILPYVQSRERHREPFLPTTTMKEDYKAWDMPQRFLARKTHETAQENTLFNVHT